MQTDHEFEIVVLGGGPGGVRAALLLAKQGKQVALIEKNLIGGCCVHTGCIPTKTLIESAKYHNFDKTGFWNQAVLEIRENIHSDFEGLQLLLRARGVALFEGEGSLLDGNHVRVNHQVISFENLIIATGSKPMVPNIPGLDEVKAYWGTTDTFWHRSNLPQKLVILGAGVIGCEMAGALVDYVTELYLVEAGDRILPGFETEQAELVEEKLLEKGVVIKKSSQVSQVRKNAVGLELILGDDTRIETEYCLIATGRTPVLPEGFSDGTADSMGRTRWGNIFLIGDANGQMPFAHYAQTQAEVVTAAILGEDRKMPEYIPVCAFTDPPVARIGMTEQEILESELPIVPGKAPFFAVGMAKILKSADGYLKLYRNVETDALAGACVAGSHAMEILAALIPCMSCNITGEQMKQMVFAHPTLSEAIPIALMESYDGSAQLLPKRKKRRRT